MPKLPEMASSREEATRFPEIYRKVIIRGAGNGVSFRRRRSRFTSARAHAPKIAAQGGGGPFKGTRITGNAVLNPGGAQKRAAVRVREIECISYG